MGDWVSTKTHEIGPLNYISETHFELEFYVLHAMIHLKFLILEALL